MRGVVAEKICAIGLSCPHCSANRTLQVLNSGKPWEDLLCKNCGSEFEVKSSFKPDEIKAGSFRAFKDKASNDTWKGIIVMSLHP